MLIFKIRSLNWMGQRDCGCWRHSEKLLCFKLLSHQCCKSLCSEEQEEYNSTILWPYQFRQLEDYPFLNGKGLIRRYLTVNT